MLSAYSKTKRYLLHDDDFTAHINYNTPNANMADHSVGAWDELHESEASEASVFCFDNACS